MDYDHHHHRPRPHSLASISDATNFPSPFVTYCSLYRCHNHRHHRHRFRCRPSGGNGSSGGDWRGGSLNETESWSVNA